MEKTDNGYERNYRVNIIICPDGCSSYFRNVFIGVYIMHDTRTEKSLKNLTVNDNEVVYRNMIDNATMYCVRPSGTKFWLYKQWVLAEWAICQHSNPFETWNCKTEKAARELFDAATHNEQLED